jgi:spermidine synthase
VPAPTSPTSVSVSHTPVELFFLIATAFLGGAAVMIVELAGNRVLAPWFGNSLYTWTGLIGVLMISLSIGYYLGGYLADKRPHYSMLSLLLLLAAALVAIIPFLQQMAQEPLGGMSIIAGPVVATLVLFTLPGIAMATISPFVIRLISLYGSDKKIGVSAGSVSACSTLGSVVGTFVAGFALIPYCGLRAIFIGVGVVLFLLALSGYLLAKRRSSLVISSILFIGACVFTSLAPAEVDPGLLLDETSFYHRIRVTEMRESGQRVRLLRLDTTHEGAQYTDSKDIYFNYQKYWELGRAFCPQIHKAAFIGGGAFAMPEALLDTYSAAKADVLEIDPRVIETGKQFFRVGDYPRLNAVPGDARHFLRTSSEKYDYIFGDAYNGMRNVPAHLVTVEFFKNIQQRLSPEGVYLMNIISAPQGEKSSAFFKSITRTLQQVFPHVRAYATQPDSPDTAQNIILVAADHPLSDEALQNLPAPDQGRISNFMKNRVEFDSSKWTNAPVFTDEKNCVDVLIAASLEK